MAVGKNKRLSKGGKKGMKKKIVDPFTRKDWFDVKAPSLFTNRQIGKTLVNRSQGMKLSTDMLKNRSFEVSLADLENDPDSERSFRKFIFIAEEVHGKNVLTNFNGMDFTTDKIRSMVKKWQTLIEAFVDVRTLDGYLLRVFSIGFTKKDMNSQRKTCYAQKSRVRAIRKKMVETISKRVTACDLKGFVKELLPDSIAKDIESKCQGIYPLHDVYIRKVKVLKKPRFSLNRLIEMHASENEKEKEEVGVKLSRPDNYEPPVQESV